MRESETATPPTLGPEAGSTEISALIDSSPEVAVRTASPAPTPRSVPDSVTSTMLASDVEYETAFSSGDVPCASSTGDALTCVVCPT